MQKITNFVLCKESSFKLFSFKSSHSILSLNAYELKVLYSFLPHLLASSKNNLLLFIYFVKILIFYSETKNGRRINIDSGAERFGNFASYEPYRVSKVQVV